MSFSLNSKLTLGIFVINNIPAGRHSRNISWVKEPGYFKLEQDTKCSALWCVSLKDEEITTNNLNF